MMDHHAVLLAIRNRLLGVEFSTTGTTTLASTRNGYTRAAGSFITDGFKVGMEVTPVGFANTEKQYVRAVEALTLYTRSTLVPESSAGGRSIQALIPERMAWENRELSDTPADTFWIQEEYLAGGNDKIGTGPNAWINYYPIYTLNIHGPRDVGSAAHYSMADKILELYPPTDALTLADGTVVRIRSRPGPNRGNLMQSAEGQAYVNVSIPLWVRAQNII